MRGDPSEGLPRVGRWTASEWFETILSCKRRMEKCIKADIILRTERWALPLTAWPGNSWNWFTRRAVKIWSKTHPFSCHSLLYCGGAVSYTHLDVYKRQVQNSQEYGVNMASNGVGRHGFRFTHIAFPPFRDHLVWMHYITKYYVCQCTILKIIYKTWHSSEIKLY